MIDNPTYYQVIFDISQTIFLALLALCSATMYHIDQSLSLLLPDEFKSTQEKALRNIKIYNWAMLVLITIYFGIFLTIFFIPYNNTTRQVIIINFAKNLLLLAIYLITVITLYRKLRFFPEDIMKKEVNSIKLQFTAFLFGFTI